MLRWFPPWTGLRSTRPLPRCCLLTRPLLTGLLLIASVSPQFAGAEPGEFKSYREFRQWYLSHAIVSLVVDGSDPREVKRRLQQLSRLQAKGVLLGEILIIDASADPLRNDSLAELIVAPEEFSGLGFVSSKPFETSAVALRFGITRSPAWIVRHRGQDLVFDGLENPEALFTAQGEFRERK